MADEEVIKDEEMETVEGADVAATEEVVADEEVSSEEAAA